MNRVYSMLHQTLIRNARMVESGETIVEEIADRVVACRRCHRRLRGDSAALGIGPVCAKKVESEKLSVEGDEKTLNSQPSYRNISFSLKTEQIRKRTAFVTRRDGWEDLEVGDRLNACEKCQGLKKGQKVQKICVIEVVNVRREPLSAIRSEPNGCSLEGFPKLTPDEFIDMFCKSHQGIEPDSIITRIQFIYV